MFIILRCCLLLCLFLVSSVGAIEQTQEEQVLHITREVVQTLYGFEDQASLSSAVRRQIQDIAKQLAADTVSEDAFQQVLADAEKQDREESALLSGIMRNVGIGIIIFLVLLVVHIVAQKINYAKRGGKTDLKVTISDRMRTAPYVLVIPAHSESDAERVGRVLVEERLAARVDIFLHHFLTQDEEVVLVVNTVKGRLKTLQKRMVDLSLSESYLSLSVLYGPGEYMNWIADAADGRG